MAVVCITNEIFCKNLITGYFRWDRHVIPSNKPKLNKWLSLNKYVYLRVCTSNCYRNHFWYKMHKSFTGKSLSESLLFAEHGENMLCTKIVLNVRNNFCTQHVLPRFELGIFMYWSCNSMNNLSSYCGLVDAKIRALIKIYLYQMHTNGNIIWPKLQMLINPIFKVACNPLANKGPAY